MLSNEEIEKVITRMLEFTKGFEPKNLGLKPEKAAKYNLEKICIKLYVLLSRSDDIKVDEIDAGFESCGEINGGVFTYRISATLEGSVYKYKFEHRCFL